jgi:hypothetical protein
LEELHSFGGGASRVDFAPDGSTIATAGGTGTPVQVWALDPARLRDAALARLTRPLSADECRRFDLDPCPSPPV